MLHPHLPEDIRHFAKHLFATFLGLLMALGLEAWAERRQEHRTARAYLERIHADLARDVAIAGKTRDRLKVCQANDAEAIRLVRASMDAKRRGQPVPAVPRQGPYREDLFFATSAWEAAKASGVLQHVDPALLQELSSVFETLRRIQGMQDQALASARVDTVVTDFFEDWSTLDLAEQQRLVEGLQYLKGINTNWAQVCQDLGPDLERVAKLVEQALH